MSNKNIVFCTNLKTLRKKAGMTRAELAKLLSYSEKSVEKWESGNSMPPVVTICKISEIFKVSVDSLLYSETSEIKYYLGIDGGGTKTEFLLTDTSLNTVEHIILGASNPVDIGLEKSKEVLTQGIRQVCFGKDLSEIVLFAGLAGGISGDNQRKLTKFFSLFGFKAFDNGSDTANAIQTALNGKDGITVIMGTGVISFVQKNKEKTRIGGWGYLIDKGGSGFNFGSDALDCAFKYIDGRGGSQIITNLLEQKTGKELPLCIPSIYEGNKTYIASLSSVVFDAFDKGDTYAEKIIDKNAKHVADLINTGLKIMKKNAPVVICGGLANKGEILKPFLLKYLPKNIDLSFSVVPMVNGAIGLAKETAINQQ